MTTVTNTAFPGLTFSIDPEKVTQTEPCFVYRNGTPIGAIKMSHGGYMSTSPEAPWCIHTRPADAIRWIVDHQKTRLFYVTAKMIDGDDASVFVEAFDEVNALELHEAWLESDVGWSTDNIAGPINVFTVDVKMQGKPRSIPWHCGEVRIVNDPY